MICYQLSLNMWVGRCRLAGRRAAIGFINGYLVVRTGIPSFLITLGTFFMLQGVNLGVTKLVTGTVATANVSDIDGFDIAARRSSPPTIRSASSRSRSPCIWWLLFVASPPGSCCAPGSATGSSRSAATPVSARAVGVPVNKVKIGLFMGVAFLAWFYGMHLLFDFNTVQAGLGVGNEFIYIIAAVVGGMPAHRRLRLRGRRRDRRVHLRHDHPGHRLRRVGPELVQHLPRRDAAARRAGQPVRQEARDHAEGGLVMTDTISEHADPTLHKGEPLVEMDDVGKSYGAIAPCRAST